VIAPSKEEQKMEAHFLDTFVEQLPSLSPVVVAIAAFCAGGISVLVTGMVLASRRQRKRELAKLMPLLVD